MDVEYNLILIIGIKVDFVIKRNKVKFVFR